MGQAEKEKIRAPPTESAGYAPANWYSGAFEPLHDI